jgi:hypothetical protein
MTPPTLAFVLAPLCSAVLASLAGCTPLFVLGSECADLDDACLEAFPEGGNALPQYIINEYFDFLPPGQCQRKLRFPTERIRRRAGRARSDGLVTFTEFA